MTLNFTSSNILFALFGLFAVMLNACVAQINEKNRKCPCDESAYTCCDQLQKCFLKANFDEYCRYSETNTDTATDTDTDTTTDIDTAADTTTDTAADTTTDTVTDTTTDTASDTTADTMKGTDSGTDTEDTDSSTHDFIDLSCEKTGTCVVYVNAQNVGVQNQDGLGWETAFSTVQAGIDAVVATPCEVRLAQGTYLPTVAEFPPDTDTNKEIAIDTDSDTLENMRHLSIVLTKGVRLVGGYSGNSNNPCQRDVEEFPTFLSGDHFGDDLTIGKADNAYHVVRAANSTVEKNQVIELNGITITSGQADHSSLDRWRAGAGLSIDERAFVKIVDCTFRDNYARQRGGALFTQWQSGYAIIQSTFEGNSAPLGGAIYNEGDDAKLDEKEVLNSIFINNFSAHDGGAVFNSEKSIFNAIGTVFIGNTADGNNHAGLGLGGAIRSMAPERVVITNCTFYNNQAVSGGAIYNSGPGTVSIYNSIVWNNTQLQGTQIENFQIYPTVDHCVVQDWDGSSVVDTDTLSEVQVSIEDPLFADTDLCLSKDSPAINVGDNDFLPIDVWDIDANSNANELFPVDIANRNRVVDSIVDLGACEYIAPL